MASAINRLYGIALLDEEIEKVYKDSKNNLCVQLKDGKSLVIRGGEPEYKSLISIQLYEEVKGFPYSDFIDVVDSLDVEALTRLYRETVNLPEGKKTLSVVRNKNGEISSVTPVSGIVRIPINGKDLHLEFERPKLESRVPLQLGDDVMISKNEMKNPYDFEQLLREREEEELLKTPEEETAELFERGEKPKFSKHL